MQKQDTFLAIDSGTTNTRVWLIKNSAVVAKAHIQAGVRDTARTGNVALLKEGIRTAITQVVENSGEPLPALGMAAGMITSSLGLVELAHAAAPAGWKELSEQVTRVTFADLYNLSIYFVRGVRSGPHPYALEDAPQVDIIRGEETEIIGALETFSLRGPLLYIHLGSHSKIIRVDEENRIIGGITTLTGELLHTISTQTILASALPMIEDIQGFAPDLLYKGREWIQYYGLPRTLFLIRILEQSQLYRRDQLLSLFVGAMVSADLQAMHAHGFLENRSQRVILSGQPGLQPAWQFFLEQEGLSMTILSPEETEGAFLCGLQKIVLHSPDFL